MIEGLVIMLIGGLLVAVTPVANHLAHSRHQREPTPFGAALISAHRLEPVPADLADLIGRAEEALDRDALTRGVRGVAEIFDQS